MFDNSIPRAQLTRVTLDGEPATDKAFVSGEDGRTYRVRLVWSEPIVPAAEGVKVQPFVQAIQVTITRLDDDGAVERNAAGQALIVADTRLTLDAETFSDDRLENTVEATIMRLVEQQIYKASRLGAAQQDIAAMRAAWGG